MGTVVEQKPWMLQIHVAKPTNKRMVTATIEMGNIMTDKATKSTKKKWQEPRVEAVADVRETRGGLTLAGFESGTFYSS